MDNEEKGISLEGKMDDWGPYGKDEGKWLIFSIGNPEEGHGYALPRNIDDLHSQRVAHLISCKTGGRYVAHIPWSTDNVGPIAKDWSPKTIAVNDMVEKLKDFLKYHIEIYKDMGFFTSNIFIYSGHGGNNPLTKFSHELKSELNLENLIITSTEGISDKIADKVLRELHKLAVSLADDVQKPKDLRKIFLKIVINQSHASHFEHSLGAAMGVIDWKKLEVMNNELENDFEVALQKWPPLGGLGGYLIYGGKYIETLGTKDHWDCFKTLRKLDNGKVVVVKEIGEIIINQLVEYYSTMLRNS
jgi:creatinine amidohydrolase/Fe(II)-dependent formamide hydrolase-like protein